MCSSCQGHSTLAKNTLDFPLNGAHLSEFTEFTEFGESDKSLKHELGSILSLTCVLLALW